VQVFGPFGFDAGFGIFAIVWLLVSLAFWGLIIAGVILGVRWLIRQERSSRLPPAPGPGAPTAAAASAPAADPLEVLRHRYARGEIDEEEFERRRKTLTGS
jgi:putative membrane protein